VRNDHYNDFLKHTGETIRRIRKEKGLSMEEVARLADMEYRMLGRIERGESNSTITLLLRVAEALGVDLHQLFL
jgi:transcriptional regulator with XRE-family HTH domain